MDLSLKRMHKAVNLMGNPCKKVPAIQIAGTNGKGSISSFIESCLKEAGIKVGCTTSPHLMNWSERIRINGEEIPEEEFISILKDIKLKTKELSLTTFELITLSALIYFSFHKVEIIILEVGLGGRLDATTAHPFRPLIAIADIGKDHCEHLGQDLKTITGEKAAVINPGSTIISSPQNEEVMEILEKVASEKNARLNWVKPLSKDWELGLAGEFQRKNAAVAKGILEALDQLELVISQKTIKNGLLNARWPGRLQKAYWDGMPLLLDGAHNTHAAIELAKERKHWSNHENGVNWIFGIQSHKQGPEIIEALVKDNDSAWIVPINNAKSWTATEILKHCPELSNRLLEEDNAKKILDNLVANKNSQFKKLTVITGSLFFIGEILSTKKLKYA